MKGYHNYEEEIHELREEIEHFKSEKERVRKIVGSIGGMPTINTKLFNTVFLILVVALLIASFFTEGRAHLILSDLAIFFVSLKVMYLVHQEARVNHFKLWVLNSLEWRVNEIAREMREVKKEVTGHE
ncbi:MAG TPA: hypothetical protein PLF44_07460 [Candidatus Mcinerneyibacteriales bacterium]|jgi:hypothetical protein|nr:hypothetical protein [Candidatus Mcinerneyibacteriota bacterium]HOO60370.1 hypothetical protein [Candidatus Mcinerneyibacteriales bacterium]HPE21224.1 hypothetical protein [Candidatus Mcinerneyibacteriales bacterium]HPJ70701.1 hypothetical protein [Candidatus Mcinerneyibacteriales bacterium]